MVGFTDGPGRQLHPQRWSQVGADPKYDSANNTLDYDSVKGFLRH